MKLNTLIGELNKIPDPYLSNKLISLASEYPEGGEFMSKVARELDWNQTRYATFPIKVHNAIMKVYEENPSKYSKIKAVWDGFFDGEYEDSEQTYGAVWKDFKITGDRKERDKNLNILTKARQSRAMRGR